MQVCLISAASAAPVERVEAEWEVERQLRMRVTEY